MTSSPNAVPEVTLEPQWYYSSCWAASLAMAAKVMAPDRKELNQCYFIHKKQNEADKCGCLERRFDPSAGAIVENNIYLTGNHDCGIYRHNTERAGSRETEKLAGEITGKTYCSARAIPLPLLQEKTDKREPVIFYYLFADLYNDRYGGKHICLIHAIETLEQSHASPQFLIAIKDPWPTCWGTEYYMSYESYKVQPYPVNICLWDKAGPQSSVEYSDTACIQENKSGMYHTPEGAAGNILASLQYMLDNHKNTRFLEKIGLSAQSQENGKINLSGVFYEVNDVGSTIIRINSNLNQISIRNLDNTRDFKKRIYFLVQDNEIKTSLIVCKSIKKNHYEGKWFLHTLENGERYRKVIQKLSETDPAGTNDLALFRITGRKNGEVLLKYQGDAVAAGHKKDQVDYRIVSRIRFDD